MNKTFAITVITMLLVLNSYSQEKKQIQWYLNYDEVKALAMKEDKPVLLLFHGSDWCPPCIKMQKEVFDDKYFIDFTSQRILFLDVDFPIKNKLSEPQLKHNNDLKKKFGIEKEFSQGYPQVVIIDASGKVLYQEKGYSGEGTKKLIDQITLIMAK